MTKEIRKIISDSMESLGLNYEFMEWTSEIRYPYFVGEYGETQQSTEDGLQESSFILTGYTRGTWLSLEEIKELIQAYFDAVNGHTEITASGSGVAIFYSNSFAVPTGDAALKKIQINLTIKEWKVK